MVGSLYIQICYTICITRKGKKKEKVFDIKAVGNSMLGYRKGPGVMLVLFILAPPSFNLVSFSRSDIALTPH